VIFFFTKNEKINNFVLKLSHFLHFFTSEAPAEYLMGLEGGSVAFWSSINYWMKRIFRDYEHSTDLCQQQIVTGSSAGLCWAHIFAGTLSELRGTIAGPSRRLRGTFTGSSPGLHRIFTGNVYFLNLQSCQSDGSRGAKLVHD
jgi:hypothetical protein